MFSLDPLGTWYCDRGLGTGTHLQYRAGYCLQEKEMISTSQAIYLEVGNKEWIICSMLKPRTWFWVRKYRTLKWGIISRNTFPVRIWLARPWPGTCWGGRSTRDVHCPSSTEECSWGAGDTGWSTLSPDSRHTLQRSRGDRSSLDHLRDESLPLLLKGFTQSVKVKLMNSNGMKYELNPLLNEIKPPWACTLCNQDLEWQM